MKKFSKKKVTAEKEPKKVTLHTIKLTEEQIETLRDKLEERMWADYEVPYAHYAYRTEGLNIVAYESGKVVIQGKKTEEFVQFVIEGEITYNPQLGYEEVHHPEWFESHAGLDECGKGDLFGPLITCCVIADEKAIRKWREAGVRDSKTISDSVIKKHDQTIRNTPGVVCELVQSNMERYNEMMAKPRANLNLLLAWMHAKALEKALAKKRVPWGMLDQFSKQPLVQRYFKDETFDLRMQTKAEADPVVAAASIVARAEFLRQMDKLSEAAGFELKRGAGAEAKKQGQTIYDKGGVDALRKFAKMHFKTVREIMA